MKTKGRSTFIGDVNRRLNPVPREGILNGENQEATEGIQGSE